jgi:hypothetical protein
MWRGASFLNEIETTCGRIKEQKKEIRFVESELC